MNKFVFVVCGLKEHIDTLHYSLAALKKFSKNEIIVLTDLSRNDIDIVHENIIDIKTPEYFNHHQASIYLKTGVHKFLPKGYVYCYLDTDVVAVSETCDDIFNQRSGVINFAPDHCKINSFSPYAINCGCKEKWEKWNQELEHLLDKYDVSRQIKDPEILQKRRQLYKKFDKIKLNKYQYALISIKFLLSPIHFKLDDDTYYHRWRRYWYDKNGEVILYSNENIFKLIEKHSNFVWKRSKQRWFANGEYDVYNMTCNHLKDKIFEQFKINIIENYWQHWNGGVFLFDENSHTFLDSWQKKTLHIFTLKDWKTRDQGTLIATAWEFGLQCQPLLNKRYNFIADYYNPYLSINKSNDIITDDNFKTSYSPALMHVYHHFGEEKWQIWNWVNKKVKQ